MIKAASPEQISVFVKAATDRLVNAGKTPEEAEVILGEVLTKRAEELGIIPSEPELTPQDVVVGTAFQALLDKGMDEKQAMALLEKHLA